MRVFAVLVSIAACAVGTTAAFRNCQLVSSVPGVEDARSLGNGFMLLAGDSERRVYMPGVPLLNAAATEGRNGALYTYELSSGTTRELPLPASIRSFHPHGIDVVRRGNGSYKILVVNHRTPLTENEHELYSVIEEFHLNRDCQSLRHVKTHQNPEIYTPNSVTAVKGGFFVTNDHANRRLGPERLAEDLQGVAKAWVTFCSNGGKCKRVLENLRGANGLHRVDDRGTALYLNEASGGVSHVVRVHPRSRSLTITKTTATPFFPDNIVVGESGARYVAGHPSGPAFQAYVESIIVNGNDSTVKAPSAVAKISATGDLETVFADDGSLIEASTVAAVDERAGRVVIGGVLDLRGFLDCCI